jgi:glycine cleavage system H protein
MGTLASANKDLFFTKDHEWIEFQGSIARIGVCSFKLLGFKEIHDIVFCSPTALLIKKGKLLLKIKYKDYLICTHMPVDGKLIRLNEELVSGDRGILLRHPESHGWIAMISPSQPYERKDLLGPKEYQLKGKGKDAK